MAFFEEMSSGNCTVAVDCDGDDEPDYEGTVNCEYAEALEQ